METDIYGNCENCGKKINHGYDSVNLVKKEGTAGKSLCLECYNNEMAEYTGIEYKHQDLPPLIVPDSDGIIHKFNFAPHLFGDRLSIEAHEDNGEIGYKFNISGLPDNIDSLYKRLVKRIQRGLLWKHLSDDDGTLSISDEMIVRGRFEWDDETDGHLPLLVIDGKAVKWNEFGKILSSCEGWKFKMEIHDISEER